MTDVNDGRMTDDQILAEAERIKARRLNKSRFDSFKTKKEVMIRWENSGANFGESYTGIMVNRELLDQIVADHYAPKLK